MVKKEENGMIDTAHFKPGQKKETPPPASGDRVFYQSLYEQNPNSLMALQWCVTYGVIPKNQCEVAVEELARRKAGGSPNKRSSAAMSSTAAQMASKKKTKKKKQKGEFNSTGVELGDVQISEGMGTMTSVTM